MGVPAGRLVVGRGWSVRGVEGLLLLEDEEGEGRGGRGGGGGRWRGREEGEEGAMRGGADGEWTRVECRRFDEVAVWREEEEEGEEEEEDWKEGGDDGVKTVWEGRAGLPFERICSVVGRLAVGCDGTTS